MAEKIEYKTWIVNLYLSIIEYTIYIYSDFYLIFGFKEEQVNLNVGQNGIKGNLPFSFVFLACRVPLYSLSL
jgi:hypothetical protein